MKASKKTASQTAMEGALPKGGEGASATAAASASTAAAVVTKGVLPVGARVLHNDGRLGVVRQMSDSGKTRWVAYDGDDDDADAVKVWNKLASLTPSSTPLLATRSVAKDEATEPSQPIVFLSRRMSDKFDAEKPSLTRLLRPTKCADAEALWLRRALESQGVTVLPREKQGAGQDWKKHIFDAVDRCHLFVVFGTDSYGEETSSEFSTYVEFNLACQEHKPIAHIKMTSVPGSKSGVIETFTRQQLELMNLVYEIWEWSDIPTSMPDTIIPWLVGQLSPDGGTDGGTGALGTSAGAPLPDPRFFTPAKSGQREGAPGISPPLSKTCALQHLPTPPPAAQQAASRPLEPLSIEKLTRFLGGEPALACFIEQLRIEGYMGDMAVDIEIMNSRR